MSNPYTELPKSSFWRTAVAEKSMLEIDGLWTPKIQIKRWSKIATFGSCFAQHFGKSLRERKFNWANEEPSLTGMSEESCRKFNYNQFSCRTANIYTTSLLLQWVSWALKLSSPEKVHWEKDGRIYDPFRPRIEPDGFESIEEMEKSRQFTIDALSQIIKTTSVFVFTLGLTESWMDEAGGFEYPICPGTAAGEFDPVNHKFKVQSYEFVYEHLRKVTSLLREANPKIQILLTVSPVPLTATNTGKHVLIATSASKAILRAVAETVSSENNFVDYFPSYEIINSPVFRGMFFKANLREVNQIGVDFVMDSFFKSLGLEQHLEKETPNQVSRSEADNLAEIACEEAILEAFALQE